MSGRHGRGLLLVVVITTAGCGAEPDESGSVTTEAGVLADTVVGANGLDEDVERAINGVRGGGATTGSLDVYSLDYTEENASLVLTWSGGRVANGPGVDFVVFENAFHVVSSAETFMDPVIVELSDGGEVWVPFPHDYLAEDEAAYSALGGDWVGFAGVSPVLYHEEDNPVSPFDTARAGGDPFDLDDLPDSGEAGAIRAGGFTHLRLVAAATVTNPDTGVAFPHDPIMNGPDIDGVYARYVEPVGVDE
jgi:hypothetical protein